MLVEEEAALDEGPFVPLTMCVDMAIAAFTLASCCLTSRISCMAGEIAMLSLLLPLEAELLMKLRLSRASFQSPQDTTVSLHQEDKEETRQVI